ncbi:hypothetical protein CNR22_01780 [Sphingobacteriaceae bacterium]|nr:hypothetical protein CNR22_01780 [Sphingobacteriaceae bacterium]
MKFDKPPQTHEEHYHLLIKRGLKIDDEARFYKYTKTIGYYRLTGYMYPFQSNDGSHNFKTPVSFDTVLEHYLFDKKLKLILLHEIERIEISFRAIICNTYALKYGSHWYLDDSYFNDKAIFYKIIEDVKKYSTDTSDLFIKNYNSKYTDPALPASWMVFEIFTFGQTASIFENLKDTGEKKAIAAEYGTVVPILESWFKSINFIRNCCAHHSRLWNRKIPIKPMIPERKNKRFLTHIDAETNKRIYGVLSCMLFLNKQISPKSKFKERIKNLFVEYPSVNKEYMGFHADWEKEELWT